MALIGCFKSRSEKKQETQVRLLGAEIIEKIGIVEGEACPFKSARSIEISLAIMKI